MSCMNSDWSIWLGDNGFLRLNGEELGDWMRARVKEGAYGSVAVFCRGLGPTNLVEGTPEKPDESLYLQYLHAGGRIVNIGDLPFYNLEQPTVKPPDTSSGGGSLGLDWGWSSPYWGQDLPITPTPAAKAWGFETMDPSVTGFAVESVTLAFGVYTVPATGKQGASSWLKSLRPELPWSGMIKMLQTFDGNNDGQLRDAWRAANYVGKPLVIPPLPVIAPAPPASPLQVTFTAGGIAAERVRARRASDYRCDGRCHGDGEKRTLDRAARGCAALHRGEDANRGCERLHRVLHPRYPPLCLRRLPGEGGGRQTGGHGGYHRHPLSSAGIIQLGDVVRRRQQPAARGVGMPGYPRPWHGAYTEVDVANGLRQNMDLATRCGLGFSLRTFPSLTFPRLKEFAATPEFYRIDNDGKPIGTAYSGGGPSVGISHPDLRELATTSMAEGVRQVAGHPAFRPYVLTNDDFSIYYGWDYAPHVLADFKARTGLDAPRNMVLPDKCGAIAEDNPWLRWFEYTLTEVDGAYNKAETAGVVQARADARVGPIPGGMQIPLVQLWQPSQYPPYNFGKHGFNLISSYYYNTYWQPILTNTFWMEIGHMGNRDLPEWCMPDCFMTAGYSRNNLFHLLAGGVKGLAYFDYYARNKNTWPEFAHLGQIVRRIGPVQTRLLPARRDIGLLNSFTTNCFDPGHTLVQVYGYHNLLQGHFDVEMVSEDEILAGRAKEYKAILLYNVKYLRQSVYDALVAHAAKGGLVLLDSSVPFDIPGAKHLSVDIGMGAQHTLPFPPEGAHVSTPGIHDYGNPERIKLIQTALSPYIRPAFACDDIKIVATSFTIDGVPYRWFVNAQDGKEYIFCRERMGAGHPGANTPEKIKELKDWEQAEMAKGPYTGTVVVSELPGVPYDLVAGKPVPVRKTTAGYAFDLAMERFGGSLLAFYPEAITAVTLKAPARTRPMREVTAVVEVRGKKAPILGAVPLEITLLDPRGKESPISGVRATTAGRFAFHWTPASNDLTGTWTLKVTELASDKSAQQVIRVE